MTNQTNHKRTMLIYRIWGIVARVLSIVCLVAGIITFLCAILFFAAESLPAEFSAEIMDEFYDEFQFNPPVVRLSDFAWVMIGATVAVLATAATFYYQFRHCKMVQSAGTPFTVDCVRDLRRTGILLMAIAFGGQLVSEVFIAIAQGATNSTSLSIGGTVGFGLTLLLVSFIFDHALELINESKTAPAPDAAQSDTYTGADTPEAL